MNALITRTCQQNCSWDAITSKFSTHFDYSKGTKIYDDEIMHISLVYVEWHFKILSWWIHKLGDLVRFGIIMATPIKHDILTTTPRTLITSQ